MSIGLPSMASQWSCASSEDALDLAEDDDVGVDGQRLRLALA
jgi:hypothetical protein